MADGYNRCELIGNLGADPELRHTTSGSPVLSCSLATSRSYLDRDKVRQESTEWHQIAIWGSRAEALAKILQKGSRLHVSGEIRYSSYDDKDGVKRYRTTIHALQITLCDRAPAGSNPRTKYDDEDYTPPGGDDDIPFREGGVKC